MEDMQRVLDSCICEKFDCRAAVIAGIQNGHIWAKKSPEDMEITKEELKLISDTMSSDYKSLWNTGIILGGEKFSIISAGQKEARASNSRSILNIMTSKLCICIVVADDKSLTGAINNALENMRRHFDTLGF